MSNPTPITRRGRNRPSLLSRFWWLGLVALAVAVGGASFLFRPRDSGQAQPIEGYLMDPGDLAREYARLQGKPLESSAAETDFQQATVRMLHRDNAGAAALLEQVAKVAPVPVVYNDLGVLYAELNDRARAVYAFRQALGRDASYGPVRANLQRLRGFISDSSAPVTREIEPNNSPMLANLIAPDSPVDGEITAGAGDSDTFRIDAPPPPRDILAVEITNHSATLSVGLRVYDGDQRLTGWGKPPQPAGAPLTVYLSPAPSSTLYLQVWGPPETSGAYTLRARPTRAYDAFEPDDDIFSAHPLTVGESADANIMDGHDTDYYSFRSPRAGTVTIDVQNRSATLIPALSMFGPDKSTLGFGPDVRTPGASLQQTMNVTADQTYYFQVWSQVNSSGDYSVVVK
jgi:hypothetical protein